MVANHEKSYFVLENIKLYRNKYHRHTIKLTYCNIVSLVCCQVITQQYCGNLLWVTVSLQDSSQHSFWRTLIYCQGSSRNIKLFFSLISFQKKCLNQNGKYFNLEISYFMKILYKHKYNLFIDILVKSNQNEVIKSYQLNIMIPFWK